VRPREKRWDEWIDGQLMKINGSLDLLGVYQIKLYTWAMPNGYRLHELRWLLCFDLSQLRYRVRR
jgi:hypothetical protein